jgi:hypothetical protein
VEHIRSPFNKAYLCAIAVRLHSMVDPLDVCIQHAIDVRAVDVGITFLGVFVHVAASFLRLHAAKGWYRPALI